MVKILQSQIIQKSPGAKKTISINGFPWWFLCNWLSSSFIQRNNIPIVDMFLHWSTLSRFWAIESFISILNGVMLRTNKNQWIINYAFTQKSCVFHVWGKTSLKISKGLSESVIRKRTNNARAKRKSTKGQTTIYKTYI